MTRVLVAGLLGIACTMAAPRPVAAQTRENGPWWPHPIWGAEDQVERRVSIVGSDATTDVAMAIHEEPR